LFLFSMVFYCSQKDIHRQYLGVRYDKNTIFWLSLLTMKHVKHPQPIGRIIAILKRLYAFERLKTRDLAETFDVNPRTIRRDFVKIADAGIPLVSKRGEYRIDAPQLFHTDKLPAALLQAFSSNAGVGIDCFGAPQDKIPPISFAITYSNIDQAIAEAIIESIEAGCMCRFGYTNNHGQASTKRVSPIKLYTAKGKWYLLAKDHENDQIRTYDFLKIKQFTSLPTHPSDLTPTDIAEANNRPSIWSSADTQPYRAILHADAYAARYLREVPLHPTQELDIPHSDGSTEFTYTITNPMELLPQIKEWIPHIHIVEPKALREMLREDVERYSGEIGDWDR